MLKKMFSFLSILLISPPVVVHAMAYAKTSGLDKANVLVGEELGILGENFVRSGTKKCMKHEGSKPVGQYDCDFVAKVILARKIGKSVSNDTAQIINFSPTRVGVKVPNVKTGEYLVYYQHFVPTNGQYTLVGMENVQVTNNLPAPTPVPTMASTPEPTAEATPEPSPIAEALEDASTEETEIEDTVSEPVSKNWWGRLFNWWRNLWK
ncbi:MAG: hypothetical protein ABFQ62_03695 [Patescibacteria group bacterium]